MRRWNDFSPTAPLTITLSKQDLDNLFFAIDENTRATVALQKALIDYTNGNLDEANKANLESTHRVGLSSNRLRLFMNAVMVGAELET